MNTLSMFLLIAGIIVAYFVISRLSKRRSRMSTTDVSNIIERFIEGKGTDWEWDDFISSPIHDPMLDKIRLRCSQLDKEFPSARPEEYTNEKGLEVLRQYVRQLRG